MNEFEIVIQTDYGAIKPNKNDFPRIPVKGEVIRIPVAGSTKVFNVQNILWDLDNYQIVIDCCYYY